MVLLRVLQAQGEARPAALGRLTGLSPAQLTAALDRLVALSYALRDGEGGHTVYRSSTSPPLAP